MSDLFFLAGRKSEISPLRFYFIFFWKRSIDDTPSFFFSSHRGELDNKPFGLLQERSTEKRYVNWAVRLVAMAIRICFAQRSGHTLEMETNLTDNQQRYANELYDLLSKKYRGTKPTSADPNADLEWSEDPGEYIDEEMENDPIGSANGKPPAGALPTDKIDVAIQTLVYKLLHALYFTMHPDTESQASKDPISVYLLSIHINPKTGTFAKPVSITPNVAGIQWNMAPIGIRYAHELATATTMPKDDEDGSACPVFKYVDLGIFTSPPPFLLRYLSRFITL